jgi:alpha-mannosidase
MLAHQAPWELAAIPRAAWEYNQPPIVIPESAPQAFRSFLETSANIIVEAVRREENHIEVRFAESLGLPGTATVKLSLPHGKTYITNLAGRRKFELFGSGVYTIPVQPQQIVTLHFETEESLPVPAPITSWDPFVPAQKLAALHAYDPTLKGHPPFGGGSANF